MATQDGRDFDFGRAALSVLAGAAAGAGTSNIGTGFGAGLATAQQQQERERQRSIQERQLQQRDILTQQRIQAGELGLEEQRLRLQQRRDREALSGFDQELQMLSKLGEQNRMRYQKDYISKATRPIETDGAITYGLDEDRADLVDAHTRASKTLSNVDSYMLSLERMLTSDNPAEKAAATRMQRALGVDLGFEYIPATDGRPEQVRTPYGAFPVEFASGKKIKDLVMADVEANRKNYEHHNRTRSQTGYAAQRTMHRAMENMSNLSSNEAAGMAQGYQNAVQGNDFLDRNLTMAHGMDRILKGKDPNQSQMELVHLTNILDKANVEYIPDPNGEFYVNADDFNKYVNRYNREDQSIKVIDDEGLVKVDEDLVQQIFNRSGLNSLRDQWVGQAQSMNNRNRAAKIEALGFKEQAERRERFLEAEDKATIAERGIQRRVQRLDPKIDIETTLNNYVLKTPDGETTLGPVAQRGVLVNAQNRVRKQIESQPRKQFKARYGSEPEQFFSQPVTDENSDQIEKAQRWWDRRKFDPERDKDKVDSAARAFLRELRKPSVFKDFQVALGTQEIRSQAAEAFSTGGGQAIEEQSKSVVDRLLGGE